MTRTRFAFFAAAAALCAVSSPAFAQDSAGAPPPMPAYQGQWQGQWTGENGQTYEGQWTGTYDPHAAGYQWGPPPGMDPEAMRDWQALAERCRDYRRSSGMTGAVIGGMAGGVAGNRIAKGDRTLGTVAGAAIGAAAGAAIEKGIDAKKRHECEEFWARSGPHMGYPGGAYPQMAYPMPGGYPMAYPMPGGAYPGYGYAPYGYVWVPVMMPGKPKTCVETTTTTTTYVSVPSRRRVIPRRTKYIREKPVRQKYIKE